MAKSKKNSRRNAATPAASSTKGTNKPANGLMTKEITYTLADLRSDHEIWYQICVLIYDLRNMTKDKTCENRTLQTTDALYISSPYFSDEEAAIVKSAVTGDGLTIEQAISNSLQDFFEKRKASGDCRPCGPHDMVPVYLSCFGIDKAEIEDEKFVSRVKRSGLGGR